MDYPAEFIYTSIMEDKLEEQDLDNFKWCVEKLLMNKPLLEVVEYVLLIASKVSDIQFKLYTKDFYLQDGLLKSTEEKEEYIPIKNGSGVTAKINEKLSILKVAAEYGLKLKGNKCICPFHPDSDPSLTFDTSRNRFKCWSSNCGKNGNLIDFIYECEQVGLVRSKNEN